MLSESEWVTCDDCSEVCRVALRRGRILLDSVHRTSFEVVESPSSRTGSCVVQRILRGVARSGFAFRFGHARIEETLQAIHNRIPSFATQIATLLSIFGTSSKQLFDVG